MRHTTTLNQVTSSAQWKRTPSPVFQSVYFSLCRLSYLASPNLKQNLTLQANRQALSRCKSKSHPCPKAARASPLFVHSFASPLPGGHRRCYYSTSGTKVFASLHSVPLRPLTPLNSVPEAPFHYIPFAQL